MLKLGPYGQIEQLEGQKLVQCRELIIFLQARRFKSLEVQEGDPLVAFLLVTIFCDACEGILDGLQR